MPTERHADAASRRDDGDDVVSEAASRAVVAVAEARAVLAPPAEAAWRALVALVAPPACAACRAPLPHADARVCPTCLRGLPWLGRCCPRCALPGHRGRACPAGGASFDRAWAPLAHDGPARALVGALKLRAALPLAELMAAQLAANLPAELRAGAVVPVPPQRARARRRGFDPAALLAAGLARRLELPLVACLRRVDRAPRQRGSGRSERRRPGRIAVRLVAPPPSSALLVDDVHTTGATLEAAAAALRAGGARRIVAVSYTRTL